MKLYSPIKRIIDILISLTVLTFGLPLFLLIAVLIKLDSPGPVLFKQKRLGSGKKPFTLYKFRTMVKDADDLKEKYMHLNQAPFPAFKIPDDPRLTKIGGYLRKSHLDELPNFINVLKGDMSIVGFRPPTEDEVQEYAEWHHRRFEGPAGITSLWVVDSYHTTSFDNWMKSDIDYNKKYSLKLDLLVMYCTFKIILKSLLSKGMS